VSASRCGTYLDINSFEKSAIYAEALGSKDVIGVVCVARRPAYEVNKRLPHHLVWNSRVRLLPRRGERRGREDEVWQYR
jgi:hypothetical protein